jgi:hypothetical protein
MKIFKTKYWAGVKFRHVHFGVATKWSPSKPEILRFRGTKGERLIIYCLWPLTVSVSRP